MSAVLVVSVVVSVEVVVVSVVVSVEAVALTSDMPVRLSGVSDTSCLLNVSSTEYFTPKLSRPCCSASSA